MGTALPTLGADFTPDDAGNPPYPHAEVINPYYYKKDFLELKTDDWDPALRFWTLPYDPQLTQWLKSVDPSRTYVMAGREFGGQWDRWQFTREELLARGWLEPRDLTWQPDPALAGTADWDVTVDHAWSAIRVEIEELQMLMQDDRDRYLAEADTQADGGPDYIVAFIGASTARFPWTIELINCGLSIGNIAYSHYKQYFKRVRPSVLCSGLVPPFGPPAHPAFPSGHSFLGHLMALLLLEIPALRQRYGMFAAFDGSPGTSVEPNRPSPQVTITSANPAVVHLKKHKLSADDLVCFNTDGKLPRQSKRDKFSMFEMLGLPPIASRSPLPIL